MIDKELEKKFDEEKVRLLKNMRPTMGVAKWGFFEGWWLNLMEFIEKHYIAKEEIIKKLDEKIINCDKALKTGAGSQFGSASGGIMLNSCKDALQEIKDKL